MAGNSTGVLLLIAKGIKEGKIPRSDSKWPVIVMVLVILLALASILFLV